MFPGQLGTIPLICLTVQEGVCVFQIENTRNCLYIVYNVYICSLMDRSSSGINIIQILSMLWSQQFNILNSEKYKYNNNIILIKIISSCDVMISCDISIYEVACQIHKSILLSFVCCSRMHAYYTIFFCKESYSF